MTATARANRVMGTGVFVTLSSTLIAGHAAWWALFPAGLIIFVIGNILLTNAKRASAAHGGADPAMPADTATPGDT